MILRIYDIGKYITIPGFQKMRTPLKLEVGDHNISLIESYLKSNGIVKFEIRPSGNKDKKISNIRKNNENNIDTKIQDDEIKAKLDRLENMLISLMEKDTQTITYNTITNPEFNKSKMEIQELDDDFIPEISLDGIEQKNNLTNGTKLSKDKNIEDVVNLLRGL